MTYKEIFDKAVYAIEKLDCDPYYFEFRAMTDKTATFDLCMMDDIYGDCLCDTKYDAVHKVQDMVLEMMTDEQAESNYFEGSDTIRTEEIDIEAYRIIINL